MSDCKAVIFDVDGTLVDSVDAHATAWAAAFDHFGRRQSFIEVRHQIGKGGDQLMRAFLAEAEIAEFGEKLEAWRKQFFTETFLPGISGFPGVRALFSRLLADGKKVALASSAAGDELDAYKEKAGIADLVQEETSRDDAEKSKPYPDIFEAALAKLDGVSAEEALVIGDTPWDAEAAGKAGLRIVGVLCGGFAEEELRNAGCMAIYRDPADLLARYGEVPWGQAE